MKENLSKQPANVATAIALNESEQEQLHSFARFAEPSSLFGRKSSVSAPGGASYDQSADHSRGEPYSILSKQVVSALWLGGIGRHLRSDAPGASSSPRRQDHRNDYERHPLSQTGVRDSLVGSFHGVATRCFQIDRSSPLAGIRTANAPTETFQPLLRPILRRKGSRHCCSVSESARELDGVVP